MSNIDFVLLIPCYNNQSGLIDSLKSVSYIPEKCEILIVDDGSAVPIDERGLQQVTKIPVHVVRVETNAGILNALNIGLMLLKVRTNIKYIARLDAGDTCNEQRFYKQVEFLNKNKEIALLATWARFENPESGKGYDYITKTKHEDILKEMHYKCSFIHPSVMYRWEVLDSVGLYPEEYPHAEDYAFFWMILKKYKGAVLPEKLVRIVFSGKNVSAENYKKQLRSRRAVVMNFASLFVYQMVGVGMVSIKLMIGSKFMKFIKARI